MQHTQLPPLDRKTAPNKGYEIISNWVEKHFRHSEVAARIRPLLAVCLVHEGADSGKGIREFLGSLLRYRTVSSYRSMTCCYYHYHCRYRYHYHYHYHYDDSPLLLLLLLLPLPLPLPAPAPTTPAAGTPAQGLARKFRVSVVKVDVARSRPI